MAKKKRKGKQLTSTRTFASNPDPRPRPIFMITSSPQAHRAPAVVAVVAAGCVLVARETDVSTYAGTGKASACDEWIVEVSVAQSTLVPSSQRRDKRKEKAEKKGEEQAHLLSRVDYARKSLLCLRPRALPVDRASEAVVEWRVSSKHNADGVEVETPMSKAKEDPMTRVYRSALHIELHEYLTTNGVKPLAADAAKASERRPWYRIQVEGNRMSRSKEARNSKTGEVGRRLAGGKESCSIMSLEAKEWNIWTAGV
ncbi:hypothetical protein C8R45DRAFT_947654 [Mycena sanguinolenta]|nr:hypothetical protein C8R45DRAFT_947654 [Mycena sanguinolenta]